MKKIIVLILVLNALLLAQKKYYSAGAYADYYLPVSGMADRFNPGRGGSISFGALTEGDWYWFGQIEYFSTEDGNTENERTTKTESRKMSRCLEAQDESRRRLSMLKDIAAPSAPR